MITLEAALAANPDLGRYGWRVPDAPFDRDFDPVSVDLAARWLLDKRDVVDLKKGRGSYALKHLAEATARTYVANGELIAAALILPDHFTVKRKPGIGKWANPNATIATKKNPAA